MIDKALVEKYGRMESHEHKLSLAMGKKLAKDHLKEYGPSYYKRLASLEKSMKKR
jgi:hypothetical protein